VHAPSWTHRTGINAQYADPRHPVEAAWDILTTRAETTISETEVTNWLDTIYDSSWDKAWAQNVTGTAMTSPSRSRLDPLGAGEVRVGFHAGRSCITDRMNAAESRGDRADALSRS
jgi:hypothetical protein